jgi:hypothetical protein
MGVDPVRSPVIAEITFLSKAKPTSSLEDGITTFSARLLTGLTINFKRVKINLRKWKNLRKF